MATSRVYKRKGNSISAVPAIVRKKLSLIPPSYSKPNQLKTVIDVLLCRLFYGTGIDDYFDFRFYSLNRLGRKSFGTVRDKVNLYNYANDPEYRSRVSNKHEFFHYYGDLMGRDSMQLDDSTPDEQLKAFVAAQAAKGAKRIVCKPYGGDSGIGIFMIDIGSEALDSTKGVFARHDRVVEEVLQKYPVRKSTSIAKHLLVLEPVIENHPALSALHPASLNTIRIPVLLMNGVPKIMGAYVRAGRDGSVVDNINSGGMTAEIDLDTGVICTPAIDHENRQYVVHPSSGQIIVGLQIPYWEEIKALVLKAALVTPQLRYVGWDVAVTPNGPVLIEGNAAGSLAIQQLPKGFGKRYLYRDILKELGKY